MVHSAKGKPGAKGAGVGRKLNGQKAWTASQIIDELCRAGHAGNHVVPGRPGPEFIARTVQSFADLRAAHKAAASIKERFNYTCKTKGMQKRRRKLRADAASLYASVYSLPVRSSEALADPDLKSQCDRILRAALHHEERRIVAQGGQVACGVVHWDEEFVHIHIMAIDPARGRVDHLHPGRAALASFGRNTGNEEEWDRQATNTARNRAYCDAMRRWQDDLYEAVSKPAGLLRYGPRRARLSRAEYKKLKSVVASTSDIEARVADLEAREEAVEKSEIGLQQREKNLAETSKNAADIVAKAKVAERKAAGAILAVNKGIEAIDDRRLDYRPALNDKPEGLQFGPKASKERKERKALLDLVRPALRMLVSYARRVSWLREKEAEIKKSKASFDAKASSIASDLRARAGIVAKAEREANRSIRPEVAAVAESAPLPLSSDSFIGAWPMPKKTDPKQVDDWLKKMPNLELRRAAIATKDAAALSEEAPELMTAYQRGIKALLEEADRRGFDLDTGRHHPEQATDKVRAKLHTDQVPKPIKVRRRNLIRQKTR
jgi:hypothetical protein